MFQFIKTKAFVPMGLIVFGSREPFGTDKNQTRYVTKNGRLSCVLFSLRGGRRESEVSAMERKSVRS